MMVHMMVQLASRIIWLLLLEEDRLLVLPDAHHPNILDLTNSLCEMPNYGPLLS